MIYFLWAAVVILAVVVVGLVIVLVEAVKLLTAVREGLQR